MKKKTKFTKYKLLLIIMIFLICFVIFLEISEQKHSFLKSWLYEHRALHELVVATVAMTPDQNPANSLEKMAGFIGRIKKAQPNVDLIFFGEIILEWFKPGNEKYYQDMAEPIPGIATRSMAKLAKEDNVYISFGMAEKQDDKIFNSQVLISDRGEIINIQRKKYVRREGFHPGQESMALVDIKGVKAGVVICFDINSQEARRMAKDKSIDIILLSNADIFEKWDHNVFGFRHMAKRFNTWLVISNRYGVEDKWNWDGNIEIINPFGDILAQGKMKEQFIVYTIKINKEQSPSKRFIQKAYLKISLGYLIFKNLKTALSYLPSVRSNFKSTKSP